MSNNVVQLPNGTWQCERPCCGYVTRKPYARAPVHACRCIDAKGMVSPDLSYGKQSRYLEAAAALARERLVAQAVASVGEDAVSLRLGDLVAITLDSVGITKERVAAWWGTQCRCDERQEKLNQLGQSIVKWLRDQRKNAKL